MSSKQGKALDTQSYTKMLLQAALTRRREGSRRYTQRNRLADRSAHEAGQRGFYASISLECGARTANSAYTATNCARKTRRRTRQTVYFIASNVTCQRVSVNFQSSAFANEARQLMLALSRLTARCVFLSSAAGIPNCVAVCFTQKVPDTALDFLFPHRRIGFRIIC